MGQAVVIMGVCGTGKTTIGKALADHLGCPFLEGDSFHPAENVAKMRAGIPLEDEDRWPWLDRLGQQAAEEARKAGQVVFACSALKRVYRDRLRRFTGEDTRFVLLHGERELLKRRMLERPDHYMPTTLLDSQLSILEPPAKEERSQTLDVELPCPDLIRAIDAWMSDPT